MTLIAGTELFGKVGIDQVTANANEVVIKPASSYSTKTATILISTSLSDEIDLGIYKLVGISMPAAWTA